MMDFKSNKDWHKDLEEVLASLLKLSSKEAWMYRQHLEELGEIRKVIKGESALNPNIRIVWRECYADAIEMWSKKVTTFEVDKKFSENTKIFATTLREALFLAMQEMEKRPRLIPAGDLKESLISFLDFIESGILVEGQSAPIIRYLANVAHVISKRLRDSQISNTSS